MINVLLLNILINVAVYTDFSNAKMIKNINNDILNLPVVITVREFDSDAVDKFSEDFQKAVDSQESIIPIVIDSYGGSIYGLTRMIDIIKSARVPVATIVLGKAMSAGAILLAMGTDGYRFAGPNSTILIHDASSGTEGKVHDIENQTAELVRLNKLIFARLAQQSHKSDDFFLKLLDSKGHIDLFLTPQQAKDYGIINHIKTPLIKVRIKTEMTLE